MSLNMLIQGANLVGSLMNNNSGPSLSERKAQMAPFKEGLDNQLKRVNEYRDMGSSFYDNMKSQLMNTMMNSVDLSNTVGNRANYGATSTIQNQQNMDRMTKGIQGIPNQLNDAWLNMQKQSDNNYQNWLSGTQQYTQGIMGAWTEEHQAKKSQWDDISGMLGLLSDAFPDNKDDETEEEETSDIRLKENIELIGQSPSGINVYEFNYIYKDGKYRGVMAQEVPHASILKNNGYLAVNYSKLDVNFEKVLD